MALYTPEQYADLVISKVDAAHHAKTGEFLNLGRYHREMLTATFHMAVTAALEQAVATVQAAGEQDPVPHIRKHLPSG